MYRYWYRIHGRCPRYKGLSLPFFPIACRTTKSHAGSVHPPAVPVLPARRLFVPVVIPERGKSSRLTKKYIPARESSRDADIGRRCCAPPPFITESPQETAERSQGVKGERKGGKKKVGGPAAGNVSAREEGEEEEEKAARISDEDGFMLSRVWSRYYLPPRF